MVRPGARIQCLGHGFVGPFTRRSVQLLFAAVYY